MTTEAPTMLEHAEGCRPERTEITAHPEAGVTTHHCLDCGSHAAINAAGELVRPTARGPFSAAADWRDVTMEAAR